MNATETQASVDAALTFGILWLDACRRTPDANVLVEGLKLFVPQGTSALVRERMANLNRDAAKWSLYELNERDDALAEMDWADRGDIATRLVHATNETAARERFAESIAKVCGILPQLRNRRAFSRGDCIPLARIGVCTGASWRRSGIFSQQRGNRIRGWPGRTGFGKT